MAEKIDIEMILIQEQIKYIQKEVINIKEYYCGKYIDSYGREYDLDYPYDKILAQYETLIDEEETLEGRLDLYKKMYQECVDLVFNEVESQEIPLVYEKSMCGTDDFLSVYEEEAMEEDEELPF